MSKGPRLTSTLTIGPRRRTAWVLDEAVAPEARTPLYRGISRLKFAFADSDRADTDHVRHLVHDIASDAPHPLSAVLDALEETTRAFLVARKHRVGARRRAYVNFNLYGDYQFAHQDGPQWTALLFVNDEWQADWGGELLLYDEDDPSKPGWSIPPKPGRLVILDGMILHRGGVPSKHCLVPRLSLALKMDRPRR